MFIYIILIGLIMFVLWTMIPKNLDTIIKNKQIVIDAPQINDAIFYTEGDYRKYPFIMYEKRKREKRLYDSLIYDFYNILQ